MEDAMKKAGFSFSFVVIQEEGTNNFYGMVKEIDGVIVKGSSEHEVEVKIHKAIQAINRARRKETSIDKIVHNRPNFTVIKEIEQHYQPC